MTNCDEDINSSDIPKCNFFDDSKVTKFFEEFSKICDDNSVNQKCCTEAQDNSECCSSVVYKIKDLKSKFKQMLQEYMGESNGIFSDRNFEKVKMQCICLKQSFYNNVIGDVNKLAKVYKHLNTCNIDLIDNTNDVPTSLCTFRNLNIKEIERIKNIYNFYIFYYSNIKDLTAEQKLIQPPKYFKKGFYEHCYSIIECLHDTSKSEYCEEFKEYNNKYNAFKVFLKSLKSHPEKIDGSDCSYGCVLSQRLFNGHYLLKLREEIQKIRYGYPSTNSQTTAITITPNELWLRTLKLINKEAHANLDDETESNSLFTSENQENTFKNKGYTI
ncbi:hypothetical protein POWCR01_000090600 [Plasmodium ovale]|uniref:PIR protein n=1 Tax=Plasmodium ovale TaxID=36330 RepID=A0A1C3KHH7_PLAOA|nr:hypothetical protein POWCR01_000090600 [Plasmodium ovale]